MAEIKREFGVVGLGRMGGNLARQAMEKDIKIVGFTRRGAPKDMMEMGLEEIAPAYHNKYFEKQSFLDAIGDVFHIADPADIDPQFGADLFQTNFLSSHYFVARILHPLMTKGEWVRNTEFVKFFSFLPPMGNYSPVQAFLLERL